MRRLPGDFPHRDFFNAALREYKRCRTYWYVPKARALNDDNVQFCVQTLRIIFDDFLNKRWDTDTQDDLLSILIKQGLLRPTRSNAARRDRTALSRIVKRLLGTLGLLWVEDNQEIVITDAGFALIAASEGNEDLRPIVEGQVAKIQYPHYPLRPEWSPSESFGIVPHLFLLQTLQAADYCLSFDEYELFVNLACKQEDLSRILKYIRRWRDLDEAEATVLRQIFQSVPMQGDASQCRFDRIHKSAPYQRAFYCYPSYLQVDGGTIRCREPEKIAEMVQQQLPTLKITHFKCQEDWFGYLGDPEQRPSWFTYLSHAVQTATSQKQVVSELAQHQSKLSEEETQKIKRLELEKAIESSYVEHPELLYGIEQGLQLKGRQVNTPIGRMDLLCCGQDGKYVVIEIKAREAEDSVFGQILRYMGWIHRNYEDGENNVRGIILAEQFPTKARYSRIGLLKPDGEEFMKFRQHGFPIEGG